MAWVFQGNPEKYGIDEYVARCPELVYWSARQHRSNIAVGDRAFIWRAGDDSGAIASGRIVEAAVRAADVAFPDALGKDLWVRGAPDDEDIKVGIALDSVRVTAAEGMLARELLKGDPILGATALILSPRATVFRLNDAQSTRLELLWSTVQAEDEMLSSIPSAFEGRVALVAHRRRERSRLLASKKRDVMRSQTGSLACETCGLIESTPYPQGLAASVFEVHHRVPLAQATTPQRTSLDDLAIVCANCHRAIHATREVEQNFADLLAAFGAKKSARDASPEAV